jgi:Tfp pilus assembly protein PilV
MNRTAQKGSALVEAVVATAVLGMGLLGASQLSLRAMQSAAETRQQLVARTLAQEALDCVLSSQVCSTQDTLQVQGIVYTRQTQIRPSQTGLHDVQVTVQWASPGARPSASTAYGAGQHTLDWRTRVAQLPRWVGD